MCGMHVHVIMHMCVCMCEWNFAWATLRQYNMLGCCGRPLLNKSMYGWILAWALTSKKGVHGAPKPVTVSAFPPWCMGLAVFAKQVLLRKHLADCYKELRPWGNAVDAREVAAATAFVILDNTLQYCTCAIMY